MSAIFLPVDEAHAATCQMAQFMQCAEASIGGPLTDFEGLHRWACGDPASFWALFLGWCGLPTGGQADPVLEGDGIETARFFPNLRLNFAECALRTLPGLPDSHPAIVFRDEHGQRETVSRQELRSCALSVAAALRVAGVQPGDRVAAIARNSVEVVAACFGAAAIGAVWSSVAPDLGIDAVLGRFSQLEPVVLFAHGEYRQHGITRNIGEKLKACVEALPSVRFLVMLDDAAPTGLRPGVDVVRLTAWQQTAPLAIESLERFEFNHPLFILFSSGTTGAPKCLVHGAGGTLLEHLKEHRLHSDFGPRDLLYFHTSCGWMMWNWMITGLASGLPLMVFDGSPTYPDSAALLRAIDEEGVTVFGTSPAYIQMLKDSGVEPNAVAPFARLRALQSTGSILYDAHYEWIRDHFKHISVQSVSGGTDIVGCFVLGNPLLPVYTGDSQSISLGLDVQVITDEGLQRHGEGELVCTTPFPSRPLGVWRDTSGERFHDSYFAQHAGVWTHGDRVALHESGSARILGRSDGTLKIRGVRIGPAELYSVVLAFPGVSEAMAVEQASPQEPGGSRIILLLVLSPGLQLDRPMTLRIKRELHDRASPNHVPALVLQVSELPQTHNGKYSEKAAREIVNGRQAGNVLALKNPQSLREIAEHPSLRGDLGGLPQPY